MNNHVDRPAMHRYLVQIQAVPRWSSALTAFISSWSLDPPLLCPKKYHRHARVSVQSAGLRGGGRSTQLRIVETATRPGLAMDHRSKHSMHSMTAGSLTSPPLLLDCICTNYILSHQPTDLVKDIRLENIYGWFLFTACNCLNTYRFCWPQRWPTH